jgi:hypothetical protein
VDRQDVWQLVECRVLHCSTSSFSLLVC